jgi:hypothetical protein
MDGISPWWPILAVFVSIWLAYRIGYRQAGIAAKSLDVTVTKATPRIGSRIEIKRSGDREHTQFALVTTLYNDGDAAASKVDGQWKLDVSQGFPSAVKPIRMDSLPSFLPFDINHPIGGTINNAFLSNPNVRINVEIDLVYFGLDNMQQRYQVRYDYDTQQRTFIQAKDTKGGN